jgi:hypothetical protein
MRLFVTKVMAFGTLAMMIAVGAAESRQAKVTIRDASQRTTDVVMLQQASDIGDGTGPRKKS